MLDILFMTVKHKTNTESARIFGIRQTNKQNKTKTHQTTQTNNKTSQHNNHGTGGTPGQAAVSLRLSTQVLVKAPKVLHELNV